ncbi:MAG: beta-ketoacyl-[acyl-carrier-protein] synthase family protein [Hyphomicrobiaceae bacterium]|nr:beta-ketoacyl-[acyl-carrier-protein] synthase family protein [Hyphomicrobiaceae bacterium]
MVRADGLRRVVVTGMGVTTPIGLDVEEFWASLKAGRCGVGRIENFPLEDLYIHIAGEIRGFDPSVHVKSKQIQYGERYSWFAGRAADEAWTMSGLPRPYANPYRSCCIIGSGAGGYSTVESAYRSLFIENKRATHPLTLLRIIGSSASAHVGIEYGIKGPTFGTCSACSTATHAIGVTLDYIRNGIVDVGVAGASEAVLTYGSMRTWQAMRVLSPEGCYPFSKKRNGTVLAEGAGILVLEELEHARRRGAPILAEVLGFGMSSDSKDMVNPDIDGPRMAMQFALDNASIDPSEVDYLNAHGTATKLNDVNETNAIKMVFGDYAKKLAISSTKSMHGHLLGAGGGVEAVACIKAINEGFVPPTIGLEEPDPDCDLDYVPNVGREKKVRYAMSNSFAFGGLNAVLVFGPAPA